MKIDWGYWIIYGSVVLLYIALYFRTEYDYVHGRERNSDEIGR